MLTEQEIFNAIPKPQNVVFHLLDVRKITQPHPYCITPKHVHVAADYHGGMLNESAIEDAERRGAHCGMKEQGHLSPYKSNFCNLSYKEHKTDIVLFIEVPQIKDLNEVPGLHAYLMSIKEQAEKLGVTGFAFPAILNA